MTDNDKADILIVDDLPDKLLVLESMLAELDENLVAARSGAEALRQVLEREFAVILLDVNMPGMDGFEAAALIRSRKKSAHTPIIFLTAFADELHTSLGYSLGAVDYILTPVVPQVLRTKVKVFVDLFRMTRQVKRQAEERVAFAREQAARAAAEDASKRYKFLVSAGKTLATSLDQREIIRGLLRQTVPFLCDLCVVDLFDDASATARTELAWIDKSAGHCARALDRAEQLHPTLAQAVQRVRITNQSESINQPDDEGPIAIVADAVNAAEAAPVGPSIPLTSALILPLMARGSSLGAMTFALGPSGRCFSADDESVAEKLAGRAAIALDNARLFEEIQESDRRKNEFLAMLAHELRNPLAPIRNACQILRARGAANPELTEVQDIIDRQVQHLARLVDDLLDISRITRGQIHLQIEPVDVGTVVADAVEVSRTLLDAKRQELTVTVPPEGSLWVSADPMRLAQALTNLLNNAAKYTEEGGHVHVSVAQEGQQAVFRVRDTGVGIPQDMLASIFDLFTQVDRSLDRSQGGLGLGLTLVKHLVELHAGTVQALSAGPKQGSEFVMRLPALLNVPALKGRGMRAVEGPPISSRRILIVDDHADAAASLARLLRLRGHDVQFAYNGPSALECAAAFRPEVVLLDIGLPGMDGYELARRLRQEADLQDTVLAALTGYGTDEDRRQSQLAGIDVHLVKPVNLEILYTLLEHPAELKKEARFSSKLSAIATCHAS